MFLRLRPGWWRGKRAFLYGFANLLVLSLCNWAGAVGENQPPVAVAWVNGLDQAVVEQQSPAGTEVTLEGSQSSDPDGDELTYAWDLDGDGTSDADTAQTQHTYPAGGPYTATLTVTDPLGLNSTATVSVTVQDTIAPSFELAPAAEECGQTIEGAGSASFSWLRYAGYKLGVAFRAPKSGTITSVTLQWKCSRGYGAGNYGLYRFELRANGVDNFPAEQVIAEVSDISPATAMGGRIDGAFTVPISAVLQEGMIYHLVVSNIDPDPRSNWSSPNTLMTRVRPWDGTGYSCAYYENGVWIPWSSIDNLFNTSLTNNVNGAHCPLMLRWQDESVTGDPYYTAAISSGAHFYQATRAGQSIRWDQSSVQVTRLGISVGKIGTPGTLNYHLEDENGVEVAQGIIATAEQIESIPTWIYANMDPPVQFEQGRRYQLWFQSPDSPDVDNCYYQCIPYGEPYPAEWIAAGWGGPTSYYIYTDQTGTPWKWSTSADLTFSLMAMTGSGLPDIVLEATSPSGIPVTLVQPTVTDTADPGPVVTNDAPEKFPLGTTIVTWTASDAAGNQATALQRVMVVDTTQPTITPPADQTVEAASPAGTPVALGTPAVSDNGDADPSITNNAPTLFALGVTDVTWSAMDGAGNVATAVQRITVVDTTSPVITPPLDTIVEAVSPAGTSVALGTPTVSDNSDENPVVTDNAPPLFPLGVNTVTWTAKDASGNEATALQQVTIVDTTQPMIIPPSDQTVEAASPDGTPVVLGAPIVTDNSDDTPVVTNNAPALFSLGTTDVTWTATDAAGNSATALQRITVVDTTKPTLTPPPDQTVEAASPAGTPVALGTPAVSDNGDAAPVITNNAPPLFPIGVTRVIWTATDVSGNEATAIQRVIVMDTVGPTIIPPADLTVEAVSPAGTPVELGAPIVSDNNDDNPVVTNDAPSLFSLGVTTVTWTVTDATGNTAAAVQQITIVDTTKPTLTPPPDLTVEAVSPAGTPVALGTPTVSDNGDDNPSVTNNAPALFMLGVTEVTWTATDKAGNTATALQRITVEDTTTPTLTPPSDQTVEAVSPAGTPVTLGTPSVSDNSDDNPVITNDAPSVFPLGVTEVTWTAMDATGNQTTALQRITVVDTTSPTIIPPPDQTVEAVSPAGTPVALGMPTVSDNSDDNPVITDNAPSLFPLGVTEVTWTATDKAGNVGTATQRVTVTDTTPPALTPPPAIAQETTNTGGMAVTLGTPTVADNADPQPTVTNNAPAIFPVGVTDVTWTARDAAGNTVTATQEVTINLAQPAFAILGINPPTISAEARTSTITLHVPMRATVQVIVVNNAGMYVRALAGPTTVNAGDYRTAWNGTDWFWRRVPNGEYTVIVSGKGADDTPIISARGTVTVQF
ncbi:MAG: HYR domain-containing protein [Armatimonadota bacterium]